LTVILREAAADLRTAIRRWIGRPVLPTAVVLTLALGIGAMIAIFSIANAVLIKPLPWPDPDRLYTVRSLVTTRNGSSTERQLLTWADWDALRGVPWLDRVGAWMPDRMLLGPDRLEPVDVIYASREVMSLLGAYPTDGRFFRSEEDWESQNVVILSHGAWTRRFGGSPAALQQTVILSPDGIDARPLSYDVIGVLPSDFSVEGQSPEFVLPSGVVPTGWRLSDQLIFRVIAKTKPGADIPATSETFDRIARSSGPPERTSLELRSLTRELLADSTRTVFILFAAAGILLLVSCASAAGLLLGNAVSRRTEVAVRLALGAGRRRIARQLALEHALLGVGASVIGLVLAAWLTPVFISMAPSHLPRLETVTFDFTVVMFALGLGVSSPLLFGTAPSLILLSLAGPDALRENRVSAVRPHTWQQVLVSIQIGLSVVLVTSASQLGGTMLRLKGQTLGFEPAQLAVITTTPLSIETAPRQEAQARLGRAGRTLTPAQAADAARATSQRIRSGFTSLLRSVIDRLAAIPDVAGVAGSDSIPFVVPPREAFVRLDGETAELLAQRVAVSPEYFSVMGIPIVAGTTFDAMAVGGDVAVVSQAFERDIAGGSAVGKQFSTPQAPGRRLRVVGVVADVRMDRSDRPLSMFYVPLVLFSQFVVKVNGEASATLPLIRQALAGSDARVVVTRATTMNEVLATSVAEQVFRAALSALLGGLALILGLIGVHALVVRWVSDRRHEFGIQIALGASPADVSSLVLRKAGIAVAGGIGVGVPAAFVAAQLLGRSLVGVSAVPGFVYVGAPFLIAVLALAGAWLPARRAGKMAPVDLFRR
jgi:ABC-type antimicrobial peptide transport system permease subunit